jgi:hypothetical protein
VKDAKEKKRTDGLKITNQHRSRTGFVYDLQCDTGKLILAITPRETPADPGDWSVEARTSSQDPSPIVAWGATRRDALRETGVAWIANAQARALPTFDWEAVAELLADVRAV